MPYQKIENARAHMHQVAVRVTNSRNSKRLSIRPGAKVWRAAMIDDGQMVNIYLDDTAGKAKLVQTDEGEFKACHSNGIRFTIGDSLPVLKGCPAGDTVRTKEVETSDGVIVVTLPPEIYEEAE